MAYYEATILVDDFTTVETEPPHPPLELQALWETEQFGSVWAGGTWDQPHILMAQLITCLQARQEVERIAKINAELKRAPSP